MFLKIILRITQQSGRALTFSLCQILFYSSYFHTVFSFTVKISGRGSKTGLLVSYLVFKFIKFSFSYSFYFAVSAWHQVFLCSYKRVRLRAGIEHFHQIIRNLVFLKCILKFGLQFLFSSRVKTLFSSR